MAKNASKTSGAETAGQIYVRLVAGAERVGVASREIVSVPRNGELHDKLVLTTKTGGIVSIPLCYAEGEFLPSKKKKKGDSMLDF